MKTAAFGILPWLVLGCGGASSDLFQELPAIDAGTEDARTTAPDAPPPDTGLEASEDQDAELDAGAEADVTPDAQQDAPPACSREFIAHCREEASGAACPEGYHPEVWLRDSCNEGNTLWQCFPNCGEFATCQALLGCPEGWVLVVTYHTDLCGTSEPNTALCRPEI